jgi:hypothetical protein
MKSEFASSRIFVRGAARYHDLVYILSKGKVLLEEDIAHTSAIGIYQGRWGDVEDTEWDSSALAIAKKPDEKLIFIGEEGDVCAYVGGNSTWEKILPEPTMIRNAKTIEGFIYACGMKRQVYKRAGENNWQNISAPFAKDIEKVGFEGIDGFSSCEIYAVGWNGEIWQYDGSTWIDRSGLTNVILTTICCVPDNSVFIGGRKGVLIKGRNDSWEIIQLENEVDADIWDLCWFNNKLYIATINDLYTLEGNKLVGVDFGEIEISSCFSLTEAEGVLWSIGKDDVASFDGQIWQKYE